MRLRAAEVDEVLRQGHSVRSEHMQLKWISGKGEEGPLRSAAVVAKALARKANKRNTLRRAIYRAIAASTPSASSISFPHGRGIFFLRIVPKEQPSAVIKEEVAFLLSKIK